MADITWPASLPQVPQYDGFGATDQEALLRTSMDTGVPKVRARFTAASELIDCSFMLEAAELVIFLAFYRTTSQRGSLPFNWTHPETGAACVARFRTPPKRSYNGAICILSISVEILP